MYGRGYSEHTNCAAKWLHTIWQHRQHILIWPIDLTKGFNEGIIEIGISIIRCHRKVTASISVTVPVITLGRFTIEKHSSSNSD